MRQNAMLREKTKRSSADAAACAPASFCAPTNMALRLDAAILAVSIFIILMITMFSLLGLRSGRIFVYAAVLLCAAGWENRGVLQKGIRQIGSLRKTA